MTEHVECVTPLWDRFVEPFFLNMFSFAAGYVYVHRDGFGRFFYKKVRQLFIPWLFFSSLTIVTAHIFSFNVHESLAVEMGRNMLQIMYHGSEMWYVAALFVAFLPFYFFIKAYEKADSPAGQREGRLLLVSFTLCVLSYCFSHYGPRDLFPWCSPDLPIALPWHLEYMFQAMFFMVLGYLFRERYEKIYDSVDSLRLCLLLCAGYLFLDILLPELVSYPAWVNFMLYYPRVFLGCMAVIALSKRLRPNRYTRFVGGNTLSYYGLHGKGESLVQFVLRHINEPEYLEIVWGNHPEAVIYALGEALLVSVLLIPAVCFINRFLPFVVGRRNRKK